MATNSITLSEMRRGIFTGLLARAKEGHAIVDRVPRSFSCAGGNPGVGPWLIQNCTGDNAESEYYTPLSRKPRTDDLHRRFARLSTDRAIIAFADRYGLLNSSRERRSAITPDGAIVWYEPLRDWHRGIVTLAAHLALARLVENGDQQRLADFVVRHQAPRRVQVAFAWGHVGGVGLRKATYPLRQQPDAWTDNGWGDATGAAFFEKSLAEEQVGDGDRLLQQWAIHDAVAPARYYILNIVNATLRGRVSPQALFDGRLHLRPDSLYAALWSLFLMEITGDDTQRVKCANTRCEERFIPSPPQRRYCTDRCRWGVGNHRKRSKAARRARESAADAPAFPHVGAATHTTTATTIPAGSNGPARPAGPESPL